MMLCFEPLISLRRPSNFLFYSLNALKIILLLTAKAVFDVVLEVLISLSIISIDLAAEFCLYIWVKDEVDILDHHFKTERPFQDFAKCIIFLLVLLE